MTAEGWRGLLQSFLEKHRGTGGDCGNAAASSGSIEVHDDDVRHVTKTFDSDRRLGDVLARLLRVGLCSGAGAGPEARARYARSFRGMAHARLSQEAEQAAQERLDAMPEGAQSERGGNEDEEGEDILQLSDSSVGGEAQD